MAVHQVTAAEVVTRCTDALREKAGVDTHAAAALRTAAEIQTCINIFRKAQAADLPFNTTEIRVV